MTTQLAILSFTAGALAVTMLALVVLAMVELRWRDRLHAERIAAKDREALARLDGASDAGAEIIRKARWATNDTARASLSPE